MVNAIEIPDEKTVEVAIDQYGRWALFVDGERFEYTIRDALEDGAEPQFRVRMGSYQAESNHFESVAATAERLLTEGEGDG